MKRKAQKTVAGILAAIAAILGTTMLWHLGYSAWSQADSGSSGIGAVSVGLSEAFVPLAGAVANRVLVRWARRAGGAVLVFHRAHSVLLLFYVVLMVLSVALFLGLLADFRVYLDPRLLITTFWITGFTLAIQFLVLAVILAFFATQKAA